MLLLDGGIDNDVGDLDDGRLDEIDDLGGDHIYEHADVAVDNDNVDDNVGDLNGGSVDADDVYDRDIEHAVGEGVAGLGDDQVDTDVGNDIDDRVDGPC